MSAQAEAIRDHVPAVWRIFERAYVTDPYDHGMRETWELSGKATSPTEAMALITRLRLAGKITSYVKSPGFRVRLGG